jgi:hypothetical protein
VGARDRGGDVRGLGTGRAQVRRRRLRPGLALDRSRRRRGEGRAGPATRRRAGHLLERRAAARVAHRGVRRDLRPVRPDSLVARGWTRPAEEGFAALRRRAAAAIHETGRFAEPDECRLAWERRYSRDEWLDQVPTQGDHNRLPAATQRQLLAEIGAAVDARGGAFTMRYTVLALTARRAPD